MDNEQPPEKPETLSQLEQNWQVVEKPFVSSTLIIGRLVAWLRTAWNNVATKWYVRSIIQQQNEFNRLTVRQHEYLHERLWEIDSRLIAQDRDQSVLSHTMAELATEISQMNGLLQSIEARLANLESQE